MASVRSLTTHRRQLPVLLRWGRHRWYLRQPTVAALTLWVAPRLRWSCYLRPWRGHRAWVITPRWHR